MRNLNTFTWIKNHKCEIIRINVLKSFGCSRYVYNHFLNQRNEIYKAEKRCMKYAEQQNQLPSIIKELMWLKEFDSTALQISLRNLDTAFKNFFEGRADRKNSKVKETTIKHIQVIL